MRVFNIFNWVTLILVIVGGINWGLVGLFQFDLVTALFGVGFNRVIYTIVGFAAVALLISALRSLSEHDEHSHLTPTATTRI